MIDLMFDIIYIYGSYVYVCEKTVRWYEKRAYDYIWMDIKIDTQMMNILR